MPTLRKPTQAELQELQAQGIDISRLPDEMEFLSPEEMRQESARQLVGEGGRLSAIGNTLAAHGGSYAGGAGGMALGVLAAPAIAAGLGLSATGIGATVGIPLVAAGLGGAGGAFLGGKAQQKIVPASIEQPLEEKAAAYQELYPNTTLGTDLIAGALTAGGRPSLRSPALALKALTGGRAGMGAAVTDAATKQAVMNSLIAPALNVPIQAGLEFAQTGEVDPKNLALSALTGSMFAEPSPLGRRLIPSWKPLPPRQAVKVPDKASRMTLADGNDPMLVEELQARKAKEKQYADDEAAQSADFQQKAMRIQQMEEDQYNAAVSEKAKKLNTWEKYSQFWTDEKKFSDATVKREFTRRFKLNAPAKDAPPVEKAAFNESLAQLKKVPASAMRRELWRQDFADMNPEGFAQHEAQAQAQLAEMQRQVAEQNAKLQDEAAKAAAAKQAEQDAKVQRDADARLAKWLEQQKAATVEAQRLAVIEADKQRKAAEVQRKVQQFKNIVNTQKLATGAVERGVSGPEQRPLHTTEEPTLPAVETTSDLTPEELAQQDVEQRLSGGKRDLYQEKTTPSSEEETGTHFADDPELLKLFAESGTELGVLPEGEKLTTPEGKAARGVSLDPATLAGKRLALLSDMAQSDTGYHEYLHQTIRDMQASGNPYLRRLATKLKSQIGGEEGQVQVGGKELRDIVKKAATATRTEKVMDWLKASKANIAARLGSEDPATLRRAAINFGRSRAGEGNDLYIRGVAPSGAKYQPIGEFSYGNLSDEDKATYSKLHSEAMAARQQHNKLPSDEASNALIDAEKAIIDFEKAHTASGNAQPVEDDAKLYDELNARRIEMIRKGDYNSKEFRDLWQQLEDVKNRHGGLPPKNASNSKYQTVKLTKLEAQEVDYKIGILLDNEDLMADYNLTKEQVNELYDSIPKQGGEWKVPSHSIAAVKGELLDHAQVLRDQASDLRSENNVGHALASDRLANRMETIANSQEGDKYQEVEPRRERSSFMPLLTSRVDKIAEKFPTKEGQYVSNKLHSFTGDMDYMIGRIGNRLMQSASTLDAHSIEKVYHYLHDVDNTGESIIHLNPSERTVADKIVELLREPRKDQIAMGLKVKEGKRLRVAGIKPEGYMFNMLSLDAAYEWAQHPNSEKSKAQDKAYIDHQLSKGESLEDAEQMLYEYKEALGNDVTKDVEFGALRKAEGNGLPWELVDQNFASASNRYAKRAARDLSFFKWIQNDSKMRKALNIKDQEGVLPKKDEHPEFGGMSSSDEVAKAKRSIYGIDSPRSPQLMAAARAAGNTVMGVGTSARNVVNMPSFIAGYVQIPQLPKVFEAFTKLNDSKARAFANNAVKASFQHFDAAGYVVDNPDPAIRLADKYSAFMRKWQGRDLSDKFEGEFYYSLGELLAVDNVARAKSGNKESLRFIKRFGDIVEGGGESLLNREVTQDDIGRMAKRFVDGARGTYSEEGLPSWAIEGEISPFTALSRFSIEKANTIWKDVIEPARQGIYGPLVRYALASFGIGITIEKLNELLSGKRAPDATVSEVLTAGSKGDLMAKAVGLLQLASFAGVISDGAKAALNVGQGKGLKYNNPLSFPLYSLVTDTIAGNIGDAFQAINEGEDPFPVLGSLVSNLATQSVQTLRYVNNNLVAPGETERREKFRDVNVFKELEGTKTPEDTTASNPYLGLEGKEFKRTPDIEKAVKLLPDLIKKAFDKAGGNIEKLRSELTRLKNNSYQTMPSLENAPLSFLRYVNFLNRTQGVEAAQERVRDYLMQSGVNRVKASLVP